MVDPHKITDFNRSDYDLQEFLLFCPAVAGKTAVQIAPKISRFLAAANSFLNIKDRLPFEILSLLIEYEKLTGTNKLLELMQSVKLGKYTVLEPCYRKLAEWYKSGTVDFRKIKAAKLEELNGFSFKTSRFFILHSQPNARIAALDTHILGEMYDLGLLNLVERKGYKIPESSPQNAKLYNMVENIWLDHCDNLGVNYAEHDLAVWVRRTKTKPLQVA